MPRRNEHARSRETTVHERWRMAELKAMSEHIDQKRPAIKTRRQNEAIIKTTPEQIVRDFRRDERFNGSIADLIQTPSLEKIYKAAWHKSINWMVVFNWACWAALIGCLIYLGIFVFAPFTARLLR